MEIIEELKISIEERDMVGVFLLGEKGRGLFTSNVTWNDLMPVIKKICKEALYRDCKSKKEVNGLMRHLKPIINSLEKADDIKVVFPSIVAFIKWYNNNS